MQHARLWLEYLDIDVFKAHRRLKMSINGNIARKRNIPFTTVHYLIYTKEVGS